MNDYPDIQAISKDVDEGISELKEILAELEQLEDVLSHFERRFLHYESFERNTLEAIHMLTQRAQKCLQDAGKALDHGIAVLEDEKRTAAEANITAVYAPPDILRLSLRHLR